MVLGAAALVPGCRPKGSGGPRIAIVGAGIAGLQAVHVLAKGGLAAEVYEAGARAGGRILTLQGLAAEGLWTEAGGEFLDSTHRDMLDLAKEFGIGIQDAMGGPLAGLIETAWLFGGRARSEKEVAEAVRLGCGAVARDLAALPENIGAGMGGAAAELDKLSLSEYLGRRGVTGWLRDLIETAYTGEFGLDAGEQSCLNLLTMVSLDVAGGRFQVFGESDERYRLQGGNQALTDAMAAKYADRIRFDHRLEAVAADGEGRFASGAAPGHRRARLRDECEAVPGLCPAPLARGRVCRDLLHRRAGPERLGSYAHAGRARGRDHHFPGRFGRIGAGRAESGSAGRGLLARGGRDVPGQPCGPQRERGGLPLAGPSLVPGQLRLL
jgi:hypothetical protein